MTALAVILFFLGLVVRLARATAQRGSAGAQRRDVRTQRARMSVRKWADDVPLATAPPEPDADPDPALNDALQNR